jgi:Bacterial HORMA domain family 1
MSYSYTHSASSTFTIVHARHLSSRVAADMHLCARYYGHPSESVIRDYAEELAQYLNEAYLSEYEFGYKRTGVRIVTWRYTVDENGQLAVDDRPGKVVSSVDVSGAVFYNFLTWNSKFAALSDGDRDAFKSDLPVTRTPGHPPSDGRGYWTTRDRSYVSGGKGLSRATFQAFT